MGPCFVVSPQLCHNGFARILNQDDAWKLRAPFHDRLGIQFGL